MIVRAVILPTILIASAVGASAQEKPTEPKPEIKDVVNPGAAGFLTIRLDEMVVGILNARAKDIIETVAPTVPIVGVEHLPRDRRFEVSAVNCGSAEEILAKLGERLGLPITLGETTTEFLVVRNLTHPVPGSWTPSHGSAPRQRPAAVGLTGIGEVDKADHLYNAYDIGMIAFVNFLTDHTDKPVWNQTALTGSYSFSFRFPHKNVMKLLNDMGFDVFNAKRTTRCVVIAKKPAGK